MMSSLRLKMFSSKPVPNRNMLHYELHCIMGNVGTSIVGACPIYKLKVRIMSSWEFSDFIGMQYKIPEVCL